MLLVFDHAAQVIRQSAADAEDRQHLDEVGERRGVLEGMRRVGVDVAAAIRAEHFDRDLRRHRALHDELFVHGLVFHDSFAVFVHHRLAFVVHLGHGNLIRLNELRLRVRLEILDHALRHEEHGEHEADRQQQVICDAHEVHPEVAEGLGRVPCHAAHERRGEADADGGGDEVVNRQRRPSARDTTWWIRRRNSANWCWW